MATIVIKVHAKQSVQKLSQIYNLSVIHVNVIPIDIAIGLLILLLFLILGEKISAI